MPLGIFFGAFEGENSRCIGKISGKVLTSEKMQQVGPPLKTQIESVLTKPQKDAIAKYEAAHPRRQGGGFGGMRGPGGPGAGPGAVGNRPPNGGR